MSKKPEDRFVWKVIIDQPFVKDHLHIEQNSNNELALTTPLDEYQRLEKERQRIEILEHFEKRKKATIPVFPRLGRPKYHNITMDDNALASSMDSIQNIVQTDLENNDTDIEELCKGGRQLPLPKKRIPLRNNIQRHPGDFFNVDAMYNVADNMNLVVQRYEDNFDMQTEANAPAALTPVVAVAEVHESNEKSLEQPTRDLEASKDSTKSRDHTVTPNTLKSKNKDLEKRKLNQNLDNFSVRLNNNASQGEEQWPSEQLKSLSIEPHDSM